MVAFRDWEVDDDHFHKWSHASRRLVDLQSVTFNFENGVTMKNLLTLCYGRASSDQHDAVYSLISMAKEPNGTIDYSDTVIDCSQNTIETILQATKSLDIICHSQGIRDGHEHHHQSWQSSWMPRFCTSNSAEANGCAQYSPESLTTMRHKAGSAIFDYEQEVFKDRSPYSASLDSLPDVIFHKNGYRLEVKCFCIDKIARALPLPLYKSELYNSEELTIPKEWRDTALNLPRKEQKMGSMAIFSQNLAQNPFQHNLEQFRRTLTVNRNKVMLDDHGDVIFDEAGKPCGVYSNPPDEWGEEYKEWIRGEM
jgi:hypothetical protein